MSFPWTAQTSVDELEICTRVSTAFRNEGIRTLGDLWSRTDAELMRIPNIGRVSFQEIRQFLPLYRQATALPWEKQMRDDPLPDAIIRYDPACPPIMTNSSPINLDAAIAAARDAGRYEAAMMPLLADLREWPLGDFRHPEPLRARIRDMLVAAGFWMEGEP